MSDERTSSLQRGLADGRRHASEQKQPRTELIRIARARSSAEVRAGLSDASGVPEDMSDSVAYWSGFAHGVATVLVEEGVALLEPPAAP